jgi:excisionase family DNA binding protein
MSRDETREAAAQTIRQDWRDRPTIGVVEAGEVLGIGRNSAYDAVAQGSIPSLRIGKSIRVPVAALRRLLGETP